MTKSNYEYNEGIDKIMEPENSIMKYKNFFEYLMSICMGETHCLDDMSPDVFESWLPDQDIDYIMEWADQYGRFKYIEGQRQAIKEIDDMIPNLEESIK